ncbi:unnamed protein product [Rhizoctonia solani]|uniref:Uncharacterized protein n=1 Tax=Rhizoctonia solani TaxID=456999 RepID=A0A8H3BI85_9AGAM|nr:unnamed protein product [Rhizoctonia solani]
MYFLGLSRSGSMFSQRVVAPILSSFIRSKSTTTKSILFSPSPRKLEVAVTPKRVTLKFAEDQSTKVVPKITKAASTAKDLKSGIEAKIKKGLNAMTLKSTKSVTNKAASPVKISKATATTKQPKASKLGKKETSNTNATFDSPTTVPCWVDASSTHIAIVIGDHYKVFALNNGWMNKSRDINWAETAAFEILARILAQQGRSGIVHVNSDSAAALRAMSGERVKVPEIMESVQRTSDIVKTSMFTIKGVKVSRTINRADGFTRGKTVDGYKEMKDDITVPEALVPFVTAL